MHRLRSRAAFALPFLIVTALVSCDNVQWGGADVEFVPPPPAFDREPVAPDAQALAELGMPTGPVVFHLVRSGTQARLIPVAELLRDSLHSLRRPADVSPAAYERRFRETVIPVGAQFEVFRRGAPVGTFVVQAATPVTACGVPTASGSLTTVAAAADATAFLAFRRGLAPEVRAEFAPPQVTGSIRTYASIVAERLVLQNGLPRPRSWPGAQRDVQAVELVGGSNPEMAATYLVGDSLAVGPADPQGYSVFYLADYDRARGYNPFYSQVHHYARSGKAAPLLIDYLNWDGREGPEVLLQVFGQQQSWYEVISQPRPGRWQRLWQAERC